MNVSLGRISLKISLEVITIVAINLMATFLSYNYPEFIPNAFIIYGVSLGYVFKNTSVDVDDSDDVDDVTDIDSDK